MAGVVGARFENPDQMESRFVLIRKEWTEERGYGKGADAIHHLSPSFNVIQLPDGSMQSHEAQLLRLWAKLYFPDDPYFPSYRDALSDLENPPESRSLSLHPLVFGEYFNKKAYARRMELSLLPFLFDADRRGSEEQKRVYAVVVGVGLGVWAKKREMQVCHTVTLSRSYLHFSHLLQDWLLTFHSRGKSSRRWWRTYSIDIVTLFKTFQMSTSHGSPHPLRWLRIPFGEPT